MNIGVCGIGGRMGKAIASVLLEKGHRLGAAFEDTASPYYGKQASDVIGKALFDGIVRSVEEVDFSPLDGIIDFSSAAGTAALLRKATAQKKPVVIGTTGHSEKEKSAIENAARTIPVLFSPNMSLGVNLLFKLTEIAARTLSTGFDVELFEAHHRFKKDAPSGTAKRLLEIIKDASKTLGDAKETHERVGAHSERSDHEIGIMALRGGDIVGEHTVFFCGMGERIELTHRATSRETLARGAVMALEFLVSQKPGMYTMFDVLGFA